MALFVRFVPFAFLAMFHSRIYSVAKAKSAKNNTIYKNMIKFYYIIFYLHCQEVFQRKLQQFVQGKAFNTIDLLRLEDICLYIITVYYVTAYAGNILNW